MNTREKYIEILESEEHERRMRAIAQNGNSGLNYEQDMLNGFNNSAEQLEAIREEERRGVEDIDTIYEEVKSVDKAADRKATPVYSGCVAYFPLALKEISKASAEGNRQHHDDKPLHWDRSKSGDELDAMMRHLLDHASGELFDDCGTRHIVKCGWRILAFIQKTMENEK